MVEEGIATKDKGRRGKVMDSRSKCEGEFAEEISLICNDSEIERFIFLLD